MLNMFHVTSTAAITDLYNEELYERHLVDVVISTFCHYSVVFLKNCFTPCGFRLYATVCAWI